MPLPRPLMKYALLQIPQLGLVILVLLLVRHWSGYPSWIFWTVLTLWILKDAALYPVYRKALSCEGPSDSIVGARGVARERIAPTGYILVRGELWLARLPKGAPAVQEGESVRVIAMEGLTLEILPERTEE